MPTTKKMKKEELYNLCKKYEQDTMKLEMDNNNLTVERDTLQEELVKTIDRKNHFNSEYMKLRQELKLSKKIDKNVTDMLENTEYIKKFGEHLDDKYVTLENHNLVIEENKQLKEANKTLGDTIKSYQEDEQSLIYKYENAIAELGNRETELSNLNNQHIVVLKSLKNHINMELSKYN